jgi:hypothetical protein
VHERAVYVECLGTLHRIALEIHAIVADENAAWTQSTFLKGPCATVPKAFVYEVFQLETYGAQDHTIYHTRHLRRKLGMGNSGKTAVSIFRRQSHDGCNRALVDVIHDGDLRPLVVRVVLVDAYRIDPYVAVAKI